MPETLCPCGSGLAYEDCCAPYVEGTRNADDAVALVRSRYTAFCRECYEYLVATTHPDFRDDLTAESIREAVEGVRWLRLDIRESGTSADDEERAGETVTFTAFYEQNGMPYQMAETSYFQRQDGRLYYVEGVGHRPLAYRRTAPKIGRNDPCPCGSGKKYKKCCGKAE